MSAEFYYYHKNKRKFSFISKLVLKVGKQFSLELFTSHKHQKQPDPVLLLFFTRLIKFLVKKSIMSIENI